MKHIKIDLDNYTTDDRMAIIDEAEQQGARLRLAPASEPPPELIISTSGKTGSLVYYRWHPEPRTIAQTKTLWPRRLPRSWIEHGIPTKRVERPLPHPARLRDLIRTAQNRSTPQ